VNNQTHPCLRSLASPCCTSHTANGFPCLCFKNAALSRRLACHGNIRAAKPDRGRELTPVPFSGTMRVPLIADHFCFSTLVELPFAYLPLVRLHAAHSKLEQLLLLLLLPPPLLLLLRFQILLRSARL
jgi:hypothetical protein